MKNIKTVINYIIVILLTLAIVGLAGIKIASSTILSEAYVFKMLEKSNYYDSLHDNLISNFEKYIAQSGLDETVLDGIATKEDIRKATETILANMYEGTNKEIDTNVIRENLVANINRSLEGITITENMQTAINTFVDTIVEEYRVTMSQTKYEAQINDMYKKADKLIQIGQIATAIAIIVLIILLAVLNYKRFYRGISLFGVAIMSSGAFLAITNLIVNLKVNVQHIKVLNDSISIAVCSIIENILQIILQTGIILTCIGFVIIITGNCIRAAKYHTQKKGKKEWKN